MNREFACILAPSLPLQALVRSEPDLAGAPLAVVEGAGTRTKSVLRIAPYCSLGCIPPGRVAAPRNGVNVGQDHASAISGTPRLAGRAHPEPRDGFYSQHALVTHVSRAAHAAGVRPGMTPSQARSVAPDARFREVAACVVQAAAQALADVAARISPVVQPLGPDTVVLDIEGCRRGSSNPGLGCSIQTMCGRAGLEVRVGISSGPRIAVVAARSGPGVTVVPRGGEAAFFAPLPVSVLAPSPPLSETFVRLGLRTVGDFARLGRRGLGIRLGPEALELHRLALGEDSVPITPMRPSETFQESVALDYSLDNAEPLLFLLLSALERLVDRVSGHMTAIAAFRLAIRLDPEGEHVLASSLPSPMTDLRSLHSLVRLALEEDPPPGPVVGFTLSVTPGQVRGAQGHLFGPAMPEPSRLTALMGRLTGIAGTGNVGAPLVLDTWARDQGGIAAFQPMPAWGVTEAEVGKGSGPPLQLRRFRPPVEVGVEVRGDFVTRIRGPDIAGRVGRLAGPWYSDGGWWTGEGHAGAFYDAEVQGVGILRLWHDMVADRWFVEGVVD